MTGPMSSFPIAGLATGQTAMKRPDVVARFQRAIANGVALLLTPLLREVIGERG